MGDKKWAHVGVHGFAPRLLESPVPLQPTDLDMTTFATLTYGMIILVSGVYRFLETDMESRAAIGFGLIMGTIAFVAGGLMRRAPRIATALALVPVGFAGYFFTHRLLTHATDGTSPRTILVVVVTYLELFVLLWPRRKVTAGEIA